MTPPTSPQTLPYRDTNTNTLTNLLSVPHTTLHCPQGEGLIGSEGQHKAQVRERCSCCFDNTPLSHICLLTWATWIEPQSEEQASHWERERKETSHKLPWVFYIEERTAQSEKHQWSHISVVFTSIGHRAKNAFTSQPCMKDCERKGRGGSAAGTQPWW